MPKAGNPKSSASSATRKKHAKKAAAAAAATGNSDSQLPPLTKPKKDKKDKNAPRIKSYVPPVKPRPIVPDPLDSLGLAKILPPDLVVCLRMLGKKSSVTREKGLEELKSRWLDNQSDMITASPVWLHHLPSLLTHPQRRIRFLAASIHATCLSSEELRESLWTDSTHVLATWMLSLHDVDRSVAQIVNSDNSNTKSVPTEDVVAFLAKTVLQPHDVWSELNPADVDNDEESLDDRATRLRISALGALQDCLPHTSGHSRQVLAEPLLYSIINCSSSPPWISPHVPSLGYRQPALRKAGWAFAATLSTFTDLPDEKLICAALLCSAFVEDDHGVQSTLWPILLLWLKGRPNSWLLANQFDFPPQSDSSDNEAPSQFPGVYHLFLSYTSRACSSCPTVGYPVLLLLLNLGVLSLESTLNPNERPGTPLESFLGAMWEGTNSPALKGGLSTPREKGQLAFLSSYCECVIFLLKQILRHNDTALIATSSSLVDIVKHQVTLLMDYILSLNFTTPAGKQAHPTVRQFFVDLIDLDPALSKDAFSVVQEALTSRINEPTTVKCLVCFCRGSGDAIGSLSRQALGNVMENLLSDIQGDAGSPAKETTAWAILGSLLSGFATKTESLWETLPSEEMKRNLDEIILSTSSSILQTQQAIFKAVLSHHPSESTRAKLWSGALTTSLNDKDFDSLDLLISFVESSFGADIRPLSGIASPRWSDLLSDVIGQESSHSPPKQLRLLARVLKGSVRGHFLSQSIFEELLNDIEAAFISRVDDLLLQSDPSSEPWIPATQSLEPILALVLPIVADSSGQEIPLSFCESVSPGIYVLSFTFVGSETAQRVWDAFDPEIRPRLLVRVGDMLKRSLTNMKTVLSPEVIYEISHSQAALQAALIPSKQDLDVLLKNSALNRIHPALGVLDPIIQPLTIFHDLGSSSPLSTFDSQGLSLYSRILFFTVLTFFNERTLAKEQPWIVRHLLAFEILSEDILALSPHSPSSEWILDPSTTTINKRVIQDYLKMIRSLVLYLIRSCPEVHHIVDDCLNIPVNDDDEREGAVIDIRGAAQDIFLRARASDGYGNCRMFRRIMEVVFGGDLDEVDDLQRWSNNWFDLARKIERDAPNLSITILHTLIQHQSVPEPVKMDRYRTELATSLLPIPPSKALTTGILTLRKLVASSPPHDSEVVFMMEQRAVNVVKAMQNWIGGLEDGDDENEDVAEDGELESVMTSLLRSLVPILQGLRGSHWDFIWDIIETNLENVHLEDEISLTTFTRTLLLVQSIQDLAQTNKMLREEYWKTKVTPIFKRMMNILGSPEIAWDSLPRQRCLRTLLGTIQGVPATVVDNSILAKACKYLQTQSDLEIQKLLYQLLRTAARKYTEDLVVEAGLETGGSSNEEKLEIELPNELLECLMLRLDQDHLGEEGEEGDGIVLGWLLGWMVVLDAFQDASMKVRMGYIEQIRQLGLVDRWFLPNIWHLLRLDLGGTGLAKTFKLDVWSVEEYHVELIDDSLDQTFIRVLAAHLYYRALQAIRSLIHNWILDCTDRQLSSTILAYTSAYMTPVLINAEFVNLKSPSVLEELTSTSSEVNSMIVKVLAPPLNEVLAAYVLGDEEQRLEIKVKVPSAWPLHKIEVIGEKRVGVEEKRWRSWVLGLCQIVWSQNGRISDALMLWKRNVTGHFEGQVECAICYSIISVTDGQLPKKPCKTCRNRFHSSCLFKWFTSSHSSTCPLCRSDSF